MSKCRPITYVIDSNNENFERIRKDLLSSGIVLAAGAGCEISRIEAIESADNMDEVRRIISVPKYKCGEIAL